MVEDKIFSHLLHFSPTQETNHAYMLFKKHSITTTENISGVELLSQWIPREFFVMQEPIYEYWKNRKHTFQVEILVDQHYLESTRQVYSMLELVGDVGGLRDGLSLIG